MTLRFRSLVALPGWAALVFLSFYHLKEFPGLHFDEAWAYRFSWRIAREPGFWPLTAMSPYTAPWAHYVAAFVLRLCGPSVLVYRASQVLLCVAGLSALTLALPRRARAVFPLAYILLPGLLLNARFAVELSGFHVLCFGLFLLALQRRSYGAAALTALLGTTSHILFYAVPLALLGALCLGGLPLPGKARAAAIAYFALASLFFFRVALLLPERGKATTLVLSAAGAGAFLLARGDTWALWQKKAWRWILPLAAAPFAFNALFFGQGLWGLSLFTGENFFSSSYLGALLWFAAGMVGLLGLANRVARNAPRVELWFWLLLALFSGLMMLKPAPRYFELTLLALAFGMAREFSGSAIFAGLRPKACLFIPLLLCANFFLLPFALRLPVRDQALHFLFFKDSSRDFLDKQELVGFLGGRGCRPGDIETYDPRLREVLDALSLGDWPVAEGVCPYRHVARRSEEGAKGEAHGEFLVERR